VESGRQTYAVPKPAASRLLDRPDRKGEPAVNEPADLPDDMSGWPADPFALLGVPRGSSETDLKRAYTRLIRRFKPERFPDQFRRIREAYEVAQRMVHWFRFDAEPDAPPRSLAVPEPEEPSGTQPVPRDVDEESAEPLFVRPKPMPGPRPYVDEADRLWGLATADAAGEGYLGLVDLSRAYHGRVDVPLRLYWLLAADPALDPERTRHTWLSEALTRARLGGPAAELYRRELAADPVVAVGGPYTKIMAVDAPIGNVTTVARWRLAAGGRRGG
jgi:hypothetical protein